VAQALLTAEKVAIVRHVQLACTAPYAQEGMIRRELDAFGATLLEVSHGEAVAFSFTLAESEAPLLVARLNEAGHGRIGWLRDDEV
jgi:hypothetical protein